MTDWTRRAFTDGYLKAALWAERPDGDEGDRWDNARLADETRERLLADAGEFYDSNEADIESYPEGETQAGMDLWFTRRGHGVGYWGHSDEASVRLDEAAKRLGDCELYVGDDGQIWAA